MLLSNWDTWAPLIILNRERELVSSQELEACRSIRSFYLDTQDKQRTNAELLNILKDIYSMAFFIHPMIQARYR
jgi:hypothetical protein